MKSSPSLVATTLLSLALISTGILATPTPVIAQLPQQGQPLRQERPNPMMQPIGEELLTILKNWEKAGEVTQKLEGKHSRYIYDLIYSVTKWSEGEFYYESPDRGRIDLQAPAKFTAGQTHTVNGKTHTIQKDKPERWVCDGTQVIAIDEERKEYQRIPIPMENRGKNIADGPLPFLFGISVEKMIARYFIELHDDPAKGGKHNLAQGFIHLKVKPLWQQDAANWQEAEVMLDAQYYLPKAIRLIHPGGNAETVYVFYDVKRNEGRNVFTLWKGSPFEPRLNGYQELKMIAQDPAMKPVERK